MDELQPRDDEYRFGFTKQQILAELLDHQGLIRDGCYVPTRHEVASWPAERVYWHVIGWFWESPSSLIPNDAQIEECLAVLRARPDADSEIIQKIIAEAPPPAEGGEGEDEPRGGDSDEIEGGSG